MESLIEQSMISYVYVLLDPEMQEPFQQHLPKIEPVYQKFFIRTSRLVRLISSIDATAPAGLQGKSWNIYGVFFLQNFSENNLCLWRLGCRCFYCVS